MIIQNNKSSKYTPRWWINIIIAILQTNKKAQWEYWIDVQLQNIKADEYGLRKDRRLKEEFIKCISGDDMKT